MKGRRLALVYEKLSTRGGLERYVLEFARRSAAAGARVTVVTSQVEPGLDLSEITLRPVPRSRIGLFRLLTFDRDSGEAARALDVDAVLAFGQTTHQDIHRAGGGCHAVYSRLLSPPKRWGVKNRIQLLLERDLYTGTCTRHFVVNSNLVRRQVLEEYDTDPDRVSVIHTAVDTSHFKPAVSIEHRNLIRSRHGIPPDEPLFLFVSLNHRRKGLEPLLNAWNGVDAWLLVLGDPMEVRHRRLLTSTAARKRVVYGGTAKDLAPYYHAADFFVHPTLYDACANTVLQAMASGLIALVSTRDGATDHIIDGNTGYRLEDPTNPGAICDLCQRALRLTPEDARAIRSEARARTLPLTWQNHLAAWNTLIDSFDERRRG